MYDELVIAFRSADSSAREEAEAVRDLLEEAGLSPVLLSDDAAGVPAGACEVRVPAAEAERAEEVLKAEARAESQPGDPSHELDLETIFEDMGATAEVEALGVRAVLDANGISNVLVSATPYPSLRFLVRVPNKDVERARQVLAEAREAGPAAAEEAERAGE